MLFTRNTYEVSQRAARKTKRAEMSVLQKQIESSFKNQERDELYILIKDTIFQV